MRNHSEILELVANDYIKQAADENLVDVKPNFTKRDFMNCILIFQTALMDMMYNLQEHEEMKIEDKLNMAEQSMRFCVKKVNSYLHGA